MTFLSVLYTLLISPLQLLFEVIFSIANRLIGNSGLSIIILSIAVNFLVLPLYKRADELQAEERDIQAKMAYRIKRTKQTFKGDERFFMLQEYYRINNYKPIYALKSSASLLLQIPFFIAAYRLLSGMQSLKGMPFGFIADLGKEDAMFMIGSFPVNVLPILMTLINVVTGIIYTKGHPLREKIQVYGLASVFLILLYRSPAGLVFYWLLNNVFSLVKNVFYKLKDSKKALNIVLAVSGIAVIVLSLISTSLDARQKVLLVIGGILLNIPLISNSFRSQDKTKPKTHSTSLFLSGTFFMALFTGLFIPSNVICNSVEEFTDLINPYNPFLYVVNSLLLSFGFWIIWCGIFYFFANNSVKSFLCKAMICICVISSVDYFLFGTKMGIISSNLQYLKTPSFSFSEYIINTAVVIILSFALCLISSKITTIAKYSMIMAATIFFGLGFLNSATIFGKYTSLTNTWFSSTTSKTDDLGKIPLSKNGKNVIVFMLDRAMGSQVPYIFNEKSELKEQFDGFTFYPNTISFGAFTKFGSPAIFGGYEYTPEKINERSDELLIDKHNEALKVMPVIFDNNGYSVTVCDPPLANYNPLSDLSIYKEYKSFNVFNTTGRFNFFSEHNDDATNKASMRSKQIRDRNFIMYSLMKTSPLIIQKTIYDDALYNEPISSSAKTNSSINVFSLVQTMDGISKSTGYFNYFLDSYPVLTNLANITEVNDSSENTFLMFTNKTSHESCLLQKPDYTPAYNVDNTAYDNDMISAYTIDGKTLPLSTETQITYYHVNMASFLKLGEWFDYLRKEGVYDNTRIIIVADHGREDLDQFPVICKDINLECFLPLLMFKDFNSRGFSISDEFMTNADTPLLAMKGIIDNPVNPFTGKTINSEEKLKTQIVYYSNNTSINSGNTFTRGSWFELNGNPHDPNSWKYIDDH